MAIKNSYDICDIPYLTYRIVNTGNNDGFVVVKDGCSNSNHSSLLNAKAWCVLLFMVSHPDKYDHCILHRLFGGKTSGSCHEFFILKRHLKDLNIAMPEEIKDHDAYNMLIYFNDQPLGTWFK